MDKKCGYAGKIGHNGAQVIKTPIQTQTPKGNGTTRKGNDLRTGK